MIIIINIIVISLIIIMIMIIIIIIIIMSLTLNLMTTRPSTSKIETLIGDHLNNHNHKDTSLPNF